MLGWIVCREELRRPRLERCSVCSLPLWKLETPLPDTAARRRRLRRALGRLSRLVCCAAVEEEPLAAMAEAAGLEVLDSAPLRRALLPRLLAWCDEAWELELWRGTALLRGERSDGAAWRAAVDLSRAARYVELDTGVGQEVLSQCLRSRCGLGEGGGGVPALQVCLGEESLPGIPALYLGRRCAARQRLALHTPQVENGSEALLCALFYTEKLDISVLRVQFVEFRA